MRKLLSAFLFIVGVILCSIAIVITIKPAHSQSVTPAELGITSLTSPESLSVLDNTNTWTLLGAINSATHTFTPVGGGLVINAALYLTAGGVDNCPNIASLMSVLPVGAGGYDVIFPGIQGQNYTVYNFSTCSFTMNKKARYHCSGGPNPGNGFLSTEFVFAPGQDGVIQEDGHYTSDGGYGGGIIDGCGIISIGYGTANTTQGSNLLTSISMHADPSGTIPASTWGIGDGIIVAETKGGFINFAYPFNAGNVVQPGTFVSGVSGSTLTLGGSFITDPRIIGFATASFTETSTNNFVNTDALQIGNNTYTMVTTLGVTQCTVKIGASWAISATHLVEAVNNGAGAGTDYIACSTTPNITAQIFNTQLTNNIVFTDLTLGAGEDTQPSVYTVAGTAAGTFYSATFFGGNSTATDTLAIYQLPASLAYTVQTTIGSNSVLVTAGPRLLVPGDIIWSDAFPAWTTVLTVSGTLGAQTAHMNISFNNATVQNATTTHTGGSPGKMWVVPAGFKRDATASSSNNFIYDWPVGLEMGCSSAGNLNCTGSYDDTNFYEQNLIARYITGNNTAASQSNNEKAATNYVADYFNGSTLGEVATNFNGNSFEKGSAPYGALGNCINQNSSLMLGGYLTGTNGGCASPVGIVPATSGSPWLFIGNQNQVPLGATAFASGGHLTGSFQFLSGTNYLNCLNMTGTSWYTFGFSTDTCSTGTTYGLGWNATYKSWDWNFANFAQVMRYIISDLGYTGYSGKASTAYIGLVNGVMLNNAEDSGNSPGHSRLLDMRTSSPTLPYDLRGNISFNQSAAVGAPVGWVSTADGSGNRQPFGVVSTFSGTKTAGSCVLTIVDGTITNVTGC